MEAFKTSRLRLLPLPSQSVAPITTPGPETIKQRLQALIEGTRETWTYAIFWQSFYDHSGCSVLRWGDGYYNGIGEEGEDKGKKAKATSCSSAEQDHRKKVLRELDSLVSGSDSDSDSESESESDVTDTEWFFLLSMTQIFVNGCGLPGQAFVNSTPLWVTGGDQLWGSTCERAKQGLYLGLHTLVWIPSPNGLVELGSTDFIFYYSDIINKVRDFFIRIEALELIRSSLNAERLPQGAENEIENNGHNSLKRRLAGKEKISESNVNRPWPLFSDSSNKENDGTSYSNSHEFSGPS